MSTVQRRAGPRERVGLAVLAMPAMLIAADLTVLHLAVPHLGAALAPSTTQLLWIVDIYGFGVAGLLITMGRSATGSAGAGCCCSGAPHSLARRCWPRTRPVLSC